MNLTKMINKILSRIYRVAKMVGAFESSCIILRHGNVLCEAFGNMTQPVLAGNVLLQTLVSRKVGIAEVDRAVSSAGSPMTKGKRIASEGDVASFKMLLTMSFPAFFACHPYVAKKTKLSESGFL